LVCHRALVNMHLRFDGKLGFPGGLVETEEDVETGKYCTLIKKKTKFSSYLDGIGRKVIYEKGLPNI
jgi:hypothetical protein